MNRRKRSPEELAARHSRRHRARAGQVYRRFRKRLEEVSGLGAMQAENAAVAVLQALEQRIVADERRHLEAQLPSRLRELLEASVPREHLPARKLSREAFLRMVAVDVGEEKAVEVVRAVFEVLSEHVSVGEIVNVVHQLPRGIRELWPEAVQQATASDEAFAQVKAEAPRGDGVDLDVAPLDEHAPYDELRDQVLALPAPDQLDLFREISAALLRELAPSARHGLLRELHDQIREITEDENALEQEPPPSP